MVMAGLEDRRTRGIFSVTVYHSTLAGLAQHETGIRSDQMFHDAWARNIGELYVWEPT